MVSVVVLCPHCERAEAVVKHGVNRGGTARCLCKSCQKTFTPKPNSRRVTPEKEAQIVALASERLSLEAVARLAKASKTTVYRALRKKDADAA